MASADDLPEFAAVLESAARLQRLIPDAVLVGGTSAALHAGHRMSVVHDHVLVDLNRRFDAVLDSVENDAGWATNRVTPGKIILGNLDGIETGVRQLIRRRPLEAETVFLPSGASLTVPTEEEALRVKAFLALRRNAVRDYLDCAALADHRGIPRAARTLAKLDEYYADQIGEGDGVATQVVRQFSDPHPKDHRVIGQLAHYKELDAHWANWGNVIDVLGELSTTIVEGEA